MYSQDQIIYYVQTDKSLKAVLIVNYAGWDQTVKSLQYDFKASLYNPEF